MSRFRTVKLTLYCEDHDPLEISSAPIHLAELIQLAADYYTTPGDKLLLSYFNYKVYKF
jgi:hypothetical protein